MSDKKELTEKELREAAGGKQILQAEKPGIEGKKTRPTREGKLTFRRHDGPEN